MDGLVNKMVYETVEQVSHIQIMAWGNIRVEEQGLMEGLACHLQHPTTLKAERNYYYSSQLLKIYGTTNGNDWTVMPPLRS